MDSRAHNRLVTLEAGRFFAALSVVLYHYTDVVFDFRGVHVLADVFRAGHSGVSYFFVLSGFVIYQAHRLDIGNLRRLGRFFAKRCVRLFPMFWLVSLAMLIAFSVAPRLAGPRDISLPGILPDLLLLPHGDALLSISWTLRHEMVFYALFGFAIWRGPKALWLIAAWIAISLICAAWPLDVHALGFRSIIATVSNLGFGLGIVAAMVFNTPIARRSPQRLAAIAGGAFIVLWVAEWIFGRGTPHDISVLGPFGEVGYLTAAAALVFALARVETSWPMPAPEIWRALGGCSYVLYLVHQPLGSFAMRFIQPLDHLSATIVFASLTALAVAVSLLLHLVVEKRIIAWLSPLVVRPRSEVAVGS